MALLWMDSFDQYQTQQDMWKKYAFVANTANEQPGVSSHWQNLVYDQTAPGGGNTLKQAQNTGSFSYQEYSRPFTTGGPTIIWGGWFRIDTLGTVSSMATFGIAISDSTVAAATVTPQLSLGYDSSRRLILQRGGAGGTLLATSTNTFTVGQWYHLEAKTLISGTVGQYEVRVDGTSVGWIPQSAANQVTRAHASITNINTFWMGGYANTSIYSIKSPFICDTTGSSANDFMGVTRITCARPSGAGNSTQFRANSGTNWSAAGGNKRWNDWVWAASPTFPSPNYGDNTFAAGTSVGEIDTFTFEDPPCSAGTIHAIQHSIAVRQDGAATRQIAPVIRRGGTDYVGSSYYVGNAAYYVMEPGSVDPSTSAQWTWANLAAAEFGYKVIA